MQTDVQTYRALIKPEAPECEHCGTKCGINSVGDYVCVGDANCFYLNLNAAICEFCGQAYDEHGFGMGNIDPQFPECIR